MADWSGLSSRTVRLLMKERDPDEHPLNRTRLLTGWQNHPALGVWLPLLRLPDCVLVQPERSTPVRLRTAPSKTPYFPYLLIIRSYLLSSLYTINRLLCHRYRRNLRKICGRRDIIRPGQQEREQKTQRQLEPASPDIRKPDLPEVVTEDRQVL